MSLTVGFVSQDWSVADNTVYPNGCTWYRCVLPAAALRMRGHSAHVGTLAVTDKNQIGISDVKSGIYSGHKIIVFKLVMHISALNAAIMAKENGQILVVDIDDWFDNLPKTNKAFSTTDPNNNKENNRDIYFSIIELADALICSTQFLYDFYSKKHPEKPIFLVRNSIDSGRWPKTKIRQNNPVIGWVGATPWRANDLEQLAPFFDEFIISNNLRFHHAGHIQSAQSASSLLGLSGRNHTVEPMKPITQLPELFKQIDIGIVPLNNIGFNHAKSYLKGLEYAAAGVPFVASWSPEYEILSEAGIGRVAKTQDEWEYHLHELLRYEMWNDESAVNREILESQFTIEKNAKLWETVFNEIMDLT